MFNCSPGPHDYSCPYVAWHTLCKATTQTEQNAPFVILITNGGSRCWKHRLLPESEAGDVLNEPLLNPSASSLAFVLSPG